MDRTAPIIAAVCGLLVIAVFAVARDFRLSLERVQYDALFRSARTPPPVSDKLVFYFIDNRTIKEVGHFPIPRPVHARILEGLAAAGASGTVWDYLFDRPTEGDETLAAAFRGLPSVLALGARTGAGKEPAASVDWRRFALGGALAVADEWPAEPMNLDLLSQDVIMEAAAGAGHVAAALDDDGVCRRVPLIINVNDKLIPALGLAGVMQILGVTGDQVFLLPGGRLRVGDLEIPIDERGRMIVNYASNWEHSIEWRRYIDQLHSFEEEGGPEFMRAGLEGRTVLFGSAESGSGDFVSTPTSPLLPGALVTFNVMNTILTGSYVSTTPPWVMWMLTLLLPALLGAIAMLRGPLLSAAATAGLGIVLVLTPVFLFRGAAVFLPVAPPLAATLLAGTTLATLAYTREHRHATRMTDVLARFVSPALLRELAGSGTGTDLPVAQRRELTILFVDIAGFTPFTEANQPEDVSGFLDEFYEMAMAQLFAHRGTLDKFEGDGVLAYFGAPDPVPDKEECAVAAAMAIRREFATLSKKRVERGGEQLAIRCGIATGYISVGYFGGERYASYGVVGHNVNLASRIQGQAEPGQILTDKPTAARLGDVFSKVELEAVSLKGIAKPIELWRVEG